MSCGFAVPRKLAAGDFSIDPAEAAAYHDWFTSRGYPRVHTTEYVNEAEGDYMVLGDRILAGTGFRTDPRAHAELERALGREVVTLTLVDPRFYHLDTALAVLSDTEVMYYPGSDLRTEPGRPARALPRRGPGRGGGRGSLSASTRSPTGCGCSCPTPPPAWPGSCAATGSGPSAWTSPNCSRPAAASSAARLEIRHRTDA
ncbi:hypothetical protein STENM327S_05642 [Streptomyces tendae]